MAIADRATGAAQYVGFIHSGGTVNLSGDSRTFNVSRMQETADATAGADGARSSKATLKAYGATLEALYIGTAGSATFGSADIGKEGTLLWGPRGTTAGLPKGSWPMIVTNVSISSPFDDIQQLSIEFEGQGAEASNPITAVW